MSNKRKSVLIGTYYLNHVGGSQLYTCDLIKALNVRDDIDVEFFAIERGELSAYAEDELGVPFMSKDRYDLVLAGHNVTVEMLNGKGPIVQICHGAILGLEFPSIYADFHVGIFKEVCNSLTKKGFDNILVLNGLDLQQKRPEKPIHPQLKKVLSLCQSEDANAMLWNVCDKLGIEFSSFNKHKNPTFHIEKEINKADMVVGIGRSIYDAMACGRPCIVFDSRDYNGNKGDGTYTRIYSVRLWKLIVPAVTEVNIFRKMNWSMSFGNTIRKTEHGCGPLPGSNWMLQRQPTLYWMP